MNSKTMKLIQDWKKKYNSTPNGWAVAHLIGEEYVSHYKRSREKKRKEKRIKKSECCI